MQPDGQLLGVITWTDSVGSVGLADSATTNRLQTAPLDGAGTHATDVSPSCVRWMNGRGADYWILAIRSHSL